MQGCTACTTTSLSHILTGTEQTVMPDDNIGVELETISLFPLIIMLFE